MKILASLILASLFVTSAIAATTNAPVAVSTNASVWTLSLSGGGSTSLKSDGNSTVGSEFELGRITPVTIPLVKWNTDLNYGVRQGVGYSDANNSHWDLSTKLFTDVKIFSYKSFEFDTGGNVGNLYGNRTYDWVASPEAAARVYLKKDVDFFGRVEYPFDLNRGKSNESLVYTLGIRVRF